MILYLEYIFLQSGNALRCYFYVQNSQLIQIQVRNQSQTLQHNSHMQNMTNENLKPLIFLKRKHKLYKSLSQSTIHHHIDDSLSQINIINLYEFIINKQHQLHQINYYIKHQFTCNMIKYRKRLIQLIWKVKSIRQNHVVSFIYYRLTRKYPILYWDIYSFMQEKIYRLQLTKKQQVEVLTDLFLYGFPLTQDEFVEKIFPYFREFILQMVPKYLDALINNEILNIKSQKIIKTSFQQWIQLKKQSIIQQFESLKNKSMHLQSNMVKERCLQSQEISYENELQQFETNVYKLGIASQSLNLPFQSEAFRLKPIFQLKKECQTFKCQFEPSQYEKALYFNLNLESRTIQSIKKSEILKLQQHQAYTNKVKHCSTIPQCIKLSGFFIEQLNIQHNRQQLIEIIINECYYYNNISYIIKILSQINQVQPQIKDYCLLKGKKICSQNKMNQKYQKILCEMCRFNLLDQNILLDYCQKILKCQNNLVTKQIQSILEQLGTILYYRSLQTHIRINNLFERMQAIIKNKMIHFNIENLFHLKGILNFLRNYKNNDKLQSNQITKIQIKINFKFILKRMQKLLKNQEFKAIEQYLTQGINQQQYLNVYYYSSLIKQLNSKVLNQLIYTRTIDEIFQNISSGNLQNGIKWSRFLGELYSYQIINRKKLIEGLNLILNRRQQSGELQYKIKFICSAIEIAKEYLLQTEKNNENKVIISFLFQVKKVLLENGKLQMVTQCEIDDSMDYFHPYLAKIKDLEEIQAIQNIQRTQSSTKSIIFRNNLYYYLDLLNSGVDAKELAKSSTETVKYIEKSIKYIQKKEEDKNVVPQVKDIEVESKESYKTSQTVETSIKKVMKVMGRDKKTKAIKIMTYSYSQQAV